MRPLKLAPLLTLLSCSGTSYFISDSPSTLTSIHIVDRNGLSETITTKERLEQYSNVDFLKAQGYQKVLRIYSRDKYGNILAYVTSYHENGQAKQYLEIRNTRAFGAYKEWFQNGQIHIEAQVIGGEADITPQAEKTWLFDGPATAWNEKGNQLASIEYKNGELHGISRYYHDNGSVWKTIPFHGGQVEGTCQIFNPEGTVIEIAQFKKGDRHGPTIRFWDVDQTSAVEEYREGLLMTGRYFSPDGKLISEVNQGNGFKIQNSPNGIQEEEEYKNGKQEGIIKIYDKSGFLSRSFHMKDDAKHGEEIDYWYNPISKKTLHPKLSVHWHQGKIHGLVKTWYDNGIQESQKEMSNNRKNGFSTAWYRDGSLMMIEEYEQDKLVKGEYFKLGSRKPVSKVKNGEGEVTLYDPEGNFLQKINYINGAPQEKT